MASSGSFSRGAALAAMVVATKQLGYELPAEQEEAVLHFLSGKDFFVSLPTGAGKSLCYLLLPTCFDLLHCCSAGTSMVIVVSLLKCLMEDQVAKARSRGLSSVGYVSTRYGELREDMGGICKGAFSVVLSAQRPYLLSSVGERCLGVTSVRGIWSN